MKGPPETLDKNRPPEYRVNNPTYQHIGVDPRIVPPEEDEKVVDANALLEDYGWMADADEYDKQVKDEMEQEEFIENSFEDMWREEDRITAIVSNTTQGSESNAVEIENNLEKLAIMETSTFVPQAHLNPNAAEFIPRSTSDS